MVDIDWFLTQAEQQMKQAEDLYRVMVDEVSWPDYETTMKLHFFAAWATWRNILLMVKVGMVVLSEDDEQRFTYIKLKFVQYSNYLPKETSDLSI